MRPDGTIMRSEDTATDLVAVALPTLHRWERRVRILEREIAASRGGSRVALLSSELGRIYEQHLGRPDEAERAYTRALEHGPDRDAAGGLARMRGRKGDWIGAASVLEEALQHEPSALGRQEIRLLLAEIARHVRAAEPETGFAETVDIAEPGALGEHLALAGSTDRAAPATERAGVYPPTDDRPDFRARGV